MLRMSCAKPWTKPLHRDGLVRVGGTGLYLAAAFAAIAALAEHPVLANGARPDQPAVPSRPRDHGQDEQEQADDSAGQGQQFSDS